MIPFRQPRVGSGSSDEAANAGDQHHNIPVEPLAVTKARLSLPLTAVQRKTDKARHWRRSRCLKRAPEYWQAASVKYLDIKFDQADTEVRLKAILDEGSPALDYCWVLNEDGDRSTINLALPSNTAKEEVEDYLRRVAPDPRSMFKKVPSKVGSSAGGTLSNDDCSGDGSSSDVDSCDEDDPDLYDLFVVGEMTYISLEMSRLVADLEQFLVTAETVVRMCKIANNISAAQCRIAAASEALSKFPSSWSGPSEIVGIPVRMDALQHAEEAISRAADMTLDLLRHLYNERVVGDEIYTMSVGKISFAAFQAKFCRQALERGWLY